MYYGKNFRDFLDLIDNNDPPVFPFGSFGKAFGTGCQLAKYIRRKQVHIERVRKRLRAMWIFLIRGDRTGKNFRSASSEIF